MKKALATLVVAIALSYCGNSRDDSLIWQFLDEIEAYGDRIESCVHDMLDISGTLIYTEGIEYNIAAELHTLGNMAQNYHWHIRDLIAFYLIMQHESERQTAKELMNISREFIVEGLNYLNGRINTTLTRSSNMYLIAKGNQLKDEITRLAIELRDFEF